MANDLNNLLDRVGKIDADLADELRRQIATLSKRREFGLNFEKHKPETVELYGRAVRVGDKVHFLSPRGSKEKVAKDTWVVTAMGGPKSQRVATLCLANGDESVERAVEDLVVVADFRDPMYPGLVSTGKVERGGDKPFHSVINAENFHALEAMLFTCQGKVDCIYIDPPYNTGARDWKYNNDYVDTADDYKHSKWLSFIERRLKLARRLLNPSSSVLIVTVDEHEVSRLGVLLEQTFRDAEITMVTIVNNPKGVTRPGVRRFSRVEEYAFFCFFGSAGIDSWGDDLLTLGAADLEALEAGEEEEKRPRWKGLLRSGSNARRQDRPDMFFPVLIDAERGAAVGAGDPLPPGEQPDFDEVTPEGFHCVWPVRNDMSLGRWGVGPNTLRTMIDKGYVALGGFDPARRTWAVSYLSKEPQEQIAAGILVVKEYDVEHNRVDVIYADPESAGRRIKTVWHRSSHDAGAGGTDVVSGLLGDRRFTFPKSVFAVRDTLAAVVGTNPNALVLDFFAGSGTTAHALAMLNAEDGGRRRSVMVTNNEVGEEAQKTLAAQGHRPGDPEWESLGIAEHVTAPRLRAALTGERSDGSAVPGNLRNANGSPMADGLAENLEFFTLTYLDSRVIDADLAFNSIAPLLWMRAGSEGRRISESNGTFEIADTYGVLFSVDAAADFADAVAKTQEATQMLRVAYIVTDEERQFQRISTLLPEGIETIRLYESFLRTFEINSGKE